MVTAANRDSEFARAARGAFGSISQFAKDIYSTFSDSTRGQSKIVQAQAEEREHEEASNRALTKSSQTLDDLIQINNQLLQQFRNLSSNLNDIVSNITGSGGMGLGAGIFGGLIVGDLLFGNGPEELDLETPAGGAEYTNPVTSGSGQTTSSQTALNFDGDSSPEELIQLARSQLGMNERRQNAALREYLANGGVNLDPAETAWCAAFINSTLQQSGLEGTGSNMARSFLNYGEPVENPEPGDIAVFWRGERSGPYGHVGIFLGYDENGGIRVLGGNQNDSVSEAIYPAERLLGFRRPNYESPDAEETIEQTGAEPAVNAPVYEEAETSIPENETTIQEISQPPENGVADAGLEAPDLAPSPDSDTSTIITETEGLPSEKISHSRDLSVQPEVSPESFTEYVTQPTPETEQVSMEPAQPEASQESFEPDLIQQKASQESFEPDLVQQKASQELFEPDYVQPKAIPDLEEPNRRTTPQQPSAETPVNEAPMTEEPQTLRTTPAKAPKVSQRTMQWLTNVVVEKGRRSRYGT